MCQAVILGAPRTRVQAHCPIVRVHAANFRGQAGTAKEWVGVENPAPPMGGSPATQLQVMWGDFSNGHSRPSVTK